jgi:uncharacterized protein YciI
MIAVWAEDAAGAEAPRASALLAHLAHFETVIHRILVAGPLLDTAGQTVGSLLVFDVPDEAAARALMAADPYFAAGVWGRISYRPYKAVAGQWVGGKSW